MLFDAKKTEAEYNYQQVLNEKNDILRSIESFEESWNDERDLTVSLLKDIKKHIDIIENLPTNTRNQFNEDCSVINYSEETQSIENDESSSQSLYSDNQRYTETKHKHRTNFGNDIFDIFGENIGKKFGKSFRNVEIKKIKAKHVATTAGISVLLAIAVKTGKNIYDARKYDNQRKQLQKDNKEISIKSKRLAKLIKDVCELRTNIQEQYGKFALTVTRQCDYSLSKEQECINSVIENIHKLSNLYKEKDGLQNRFI